jgi:hypothetical protein
MSGHQDVGGLPRSEAKAELLMERRQHHLVASGRQLYIIEHW